MFTLADCNLHDSSHSLARSISFQSLCVCACEWMPFALEFRCFCYPCFSLLVPSFTHRYPDTTRSVCVHCVFAQALPHAPVCVCVFRATEMSSSCWWFFVYRICRCHSDWPCWCVSCVVCRVSVHVCVLTSYARNIVCYGFRWNCTRSN